MGAYNRISDLRDDLSAGQQHQENCSVRNGGALIGAGLLPLEYRQVLRYGVPCIRRGCLRVCGVGVEAENKREREKVGWANDRMS